MQRGRDHPVVTQVLWIYKRTRVELAIHPYDRKMVMGMGMVLADVLRFSSSVCMLTQLPCNLVHVNISPLITLR